MSEFVYDQHAIQERIATMSEEQLVLWAFCFQRMLHLDKRLRNLEASFVGRRPVDGELLAAKDAVLTELHNRTIAKGGQQE